MCKKELYCILAVLFFFGCQSATTQNIIFVQGAPRDSVLHALQTAQRDTAYTQTDSNIYHFTNVNLAGYLGKTTLTFRSDPPGTLVASWWEYVADYGVRHEGVLRIRDTILSSMKDIFGEPYSHRPMRNTEHEYIWIPDPATQVPPVYYRLWFDTDDGNCRITMSILLHHIGVKVDSTGAIVPLKRAKPD